MMNFRRVKKAIVDLLGNSAAGRFSVTGYEGQAKHASEVRGKKRNVQVYFQKGDFPKGRGRAYGSVTHEVTFTVELSASAAAQANLAVINQQPPAPAATISAALLAMKEAEYVVDDLMDELYELVFQILMDARNTDLGLLEGTIADRWITQLVKDEPLPQGTLVVLSGAVTYTCSMNEDIDGDTTVEMTEGVTVDFDMPGDVIQVTGVTAGKRSDAQGETWQFNSGEKIELNSGESLSMGGE